MPSNSGKPLDSAGNIQVDFVWGNFAPQPNDVRTTATDTNVSTSSATASDLVDQTKKRVVPGKDKHDDLLAGYGGYPSFSANDDGSYTVASSTGGTVGNAINTYNIFVTTPKIDGLTDVNAKDALRDNGMTGTLTATSVAGGRVQVIEAARATGVAGTVTIKGTAHGFSTGDYVAIYGLTSTVAPLNGVYGPITASTDTFTFAHTNSTSGAITNVTSITGAYAVVVSKSVATTVSAALAAGVSTLVAASTTNVTVGMNVTGTGFATGTTVQYLNGTTVGLSLPTTAAIASGASVTFATSETPVVAAKTVAYSGTATAGTATVGTVAAHNLNVGDSISLIGSTVLAATTGIVPNASQSLVVADATNIATSAVVTGPGIAAGTTVSTITGTAVGISGNSTAALVAQSVVTTAVTTNNSTSVTVGSGSALPTGVTTNGSTASGSATITVTGTVTAAAGTVVQANGGAIPAGTTVLSVAGQVLTLSQATTATIAGSTALYFSNGNASSNIVVGHLVTGAGVPSSTYVTAVNSTVITLSNSVLQTSAAATLTFSLAKGSTATAGSTSLTVDNATALVVGQTVVGAGIPDGTIITAISGTTLTLSQAALGTFSGRVLAFKNLLTFGTAATSKLNSAITSNIATAVQITAVPSATSFQYALTGLTGAATIPTASDNFVATSATSTSGGYTLNVAAGVASMVNCIVTGAGIPDGTFVTSRSTNALTISKALTADPGATPLVFYPASVAAGVRTSTVVIGSQNISGAQTGSTAVTYNTYN